MYDELIGALIRQLKELFPDIDVYDEFAPQNVRLPNFNIKNTQIDVDRQIHNNVDLAIFFFVVYTPSSPVHNRRNELNEVANLILGSKTFKYLGDIGHIQNLKARHNDQQLAVSFDVKISGQYERDGGELIQKIEGGVTIDRES